MMPVSQKSLLMMTMVHFRTVHAKVLNQVRHLQSSSSLGKFAAPSIFDDNPSMCKGFDWSDRPRLQNEILNDEVAKGWKVPIYWGMSEFGMGVFAESDIKKGTLVRQLETGKNVVAFLQSNTDSDEKNEKMLEEVENWMRSVGSSGHSFEVSKAVCHYMFDYMTGARIIELPQLSKLPQPGSSEFTSYENVVNSLKVQLTNIGPENKLHVIAVPGSGMNHADDHNIEWLAFKKESDDQVDWRIDQIAVKDIKKGEQVFMNYGLLGPCPLWFTKWIESAHKRFWPHLVGKIPGNEATGAYIKTNPYVEDLVQSKIKPEDLYKIYYS